jgi:hypothetical protein
MSLQELSLLRGLLHTKRFVKVMFRLNKANFRCNFKDNRGTN